jgi:hypothetical protein
MMASQQLIENSALQLLRYMENEKFSGYDPYDGLKSPFWQLPVVNKAHKLQFYFQQFVKRSPVNLRSALFIEKGLNPVTLGLALQSYTSFYRSTSNRDFLLKAENLTESLKQCSAKGYHGNCWGYDFPWSSRYVYIPAYQPTVVATSVITNALFDYWRIINDENVSRMITGAAEFVLLDLNQFVSPEGDICFSYSPFDNEKVFNASMKGARILSQAFAITSELRYAEAAKKAVNWVVKQQNADGSWYYSKSRSGNFIDNYHTGYILDSLDDCILYCNLEEFRPNLKKGREYYIANFFTPEGQPKFYNAQLWPADCTAGAQSIISLLKMKENAKAMQVAEWMITNMQDESGFFYFRKYQGRTDKTSFMRWSNAWMLKALSGLCLAINNNEVNKAEINA